MQQSSPHPGQLRHMVEVGRTVNAVNENGYPVETDEIVCRVWVIEARGVMYGVVATKLSARGWNRWGFMTKYFYYSDAGQGDAPKYEFGHRTLSKGDTGADVKALQEALISLSYSCGKWGADGEFGKATKSAVVAFQTANNLAEDGIVGPKTVTAINDLLPESSEEPEAPSDSAKPQVKVTGGSVYLRTPPVHVRSHPRRRPSGRSAGECR